MGVGRCSISRPPITGLTVFWLGSTTHHGGLGVGRLVTWAAEAAYTWAGSTLGVRGSKSVAGSSLPEGLPSAGAGGVIVGWRRAEALFFLVIADEQVLKNGGQQEEEAMRYVSTVISSLGNGGVRSECDLHCN